jgi:hypothetical protein
VDLVQSQIPQIFYQALVEILFWAEAALADPQMALEIAGGLMVEGLVAHSPPAQQHMLAQQALPVS